MKERMPSPPLKAPSNAKMAGSIEAAIDAGLAVQPRNLAHQTDGWIVFGLGHLLREKITIRNGRVQESNYTD